MKFNYKNRGFVVVSLSMMLIAVGVVNYQLSKDSALSVSDEFKAYEQAQIDKNSSEQKNEEDKLVDSIEGEVKIDQEKATETSNENNELENIAKETSKEIENTLNSKENLESATYIVDMKMTREKQRNELTEKLNEIINNPSTTDEAKVEASNMKVEMVKNSDKELQLENLLLAKGYEDAIVYINEGKANVVVNMEEITQNDANKIFELIGSQSDISRENIKLTNNR